jgi:hypothetical protein
MIEQHYTHGEDVDEASATEDNWSQNVCLIEVSYDGLAKNENDEGGQKPRLPVKERAASNASPHDIRKYR